MINTLIFDLDGTLLNTLEDLKDSTNFVLKKYNYPLRTIDEIRIFVGNGIEKLIERVIPEGTNNPKYSECLNLFKKHYAENMYNKTKPYNGIMDMLIKLNKNNLKIAVVSNKIDFAVKDLCKKYFGNKIQIALGSTETMKRKPAPDSVLNVMKQLKSKKEETLYIGDSDTDVKTAKNANLTCIGVTWGFRSKETLIEEGADYIIDSPDELLTLISDF